MSEKEKNVPKRRFKEFENASNWEQRKLAEIGTVQTCKRIFKEQTSESGDIPFYKNGTLGLKADAYISRKVFEEYKERYPYPRVGDVLISVVGSIGRTAEYKGNAEYFQDSNIVWLKTDNNIIDKTFLKISYQIINWLIEGSTIKHLYNDNILASKIWIPSSIDEQKAIGEFFDFLDKLITLHQHKLEKMKALKKAYLTDMFPAEGKRKPKLRFAGFKDDWEQCKVKDIFEVTRGYVLAATETTDKKTDEMPYPVYSSQTKDNGLMGYYTDFLYENAITWTTDGANAGTVNYRAGKFYCTNVCGVLLSDDGYANKMVSEALNNISWKHVSKVGNPKLMNNVMSEIVVSFPKTIEEQNAISDFLINLDNIITLRQHKLEKLRNIKKAYLNEMFI